MFLSEKITTTSWSHECLIIITVIKPKLYFTNGVRIINNMYRSSVQRTMTGSRSSISWVFVVRLTTLKQTASEMKIYDVKNYYILLLFCGASIVLSFYVLWLACCVVSFRKMRNNMENDTNMKGSKSDKLWSSDLQYLCEVEKDCLWQPLVNWGYWSQNLYEFLVYYMNNCIVIFLV